MHRPSGAAMADVNGDLIHISVMRDILNCLGPSGHGPGRERKSDSGCAKPVQAALGRDPGFDLRSGTHMYASLPHECFS